MFGTQYQKRQNLPELNYFIILTQEESLKQYVMIIGNWSLVWRTGIVTLDGIHVTKAPPSLPCLKLNFSTKRLLSIVDHGRAKSLAAQRMERRACSILAKVENIYLLLKLTLFRLEGGSKNPHHRPPKLKILLFMRLRLVSKFLVQTTILYLVLDTT